MSGWWQASCPRVTVQFRLEAPWMPSSMVIVSLQEGEAVYVWLPPVNMGSGVSGLYVCVGEGDCGQVFGAQDPYRHKALRPVTTKLNNPHLTGKAVLMAPSLVRIGQE